MKEKQDERNEQLQSRQEGAAGPGQPLYFRRGLKRFGVLLAGTLAILALSWLLTSLVDREESGGVSTASPGSAVPSVAASAAGSSVPAGGPEEAAWNYIGPQQQPVEGMTLVAPDYRMIALPENGRVDISYFNTVTMIGDSITQGFDGVYPSLRIPGATVCAYKNIGPRQVYAGTMHRRHDGTEEIPMDAIVASAPDNVYILLGTNAMVGMSNEDVIAYYTEMLNHLRAALPEGVGYYIQSVTPVRPDNSSRLSMDAIHDLNNRLAQLAWQQGVYFLDLNEVLAGEDGYLREEYAGGDGVHLKPEGYMAWTEYMITHTAYNPRNPYLEGSNDIYPPPVAAPPVSEPPPATEPPSDGAGDET